jgi:hypothetical protein
MSDIATLQPAEAGIPLTAAQLKSRLAIIQDVMRSVMQRDVDYGVIPGTDKPSLFKPGAEKLCVTFRLSAASPDIEAVPEYTGDIRYRVRVPVSAADGTVLAVGVGECSTGEEKYRWRRPVHQKEFEAAPEDQRRQKWTRKGEVWDQVRVHPADVANTVLKMAHKRAYVHAVIMATAAGAIFTQDIEDLPEGVAQDEGERKPTPQPAQRASKPAAASATAGTAATITVRDIAKKEGHGDQGPWTKWTIVAADGNKYGTFDAELARIAREASQLGGKLEISYSKGNYGLNLLSARPADRQPGDEADL